MRWKTYVKRPDGIYETEHGYFGICEHWSITKRTDIQEQDIPIGGVFVYDKEI